jgi:hypothetical protein
MNVFLSWSGHVAKVAAEGFHKWLVEELPSNRVKIYFSPSSNDPGALWRKMLRRALAQSSVGVFFLTRDSISSPWVLFEGGAVGKLRKSRVFTVLLDVGTKDLATLAPPFEEYQAVPFQPDDLWRVVKGITRLASISKPSKKDLRHSFDGWWPDFSQCVEEAIAAGLTGNGDWQSVTSARLASRIEGSPFVAKHLFRIAHKRIDFVAQNHYYMTVDHAEEHLKMLRSFLDKKGRLVRFLVMNPQEENAVKAWTNFLRTSDFPQDLQKAVSTFRNWQTHASRERWKGTLEIRLGSLIPTSQTFVDAEDAHGCAVITPMGKKTSNADRSSFFLVKARNKEAFNSYWTMYLEQWQRAVQL